MIVMETKFTINIQKKDLELSAKMVLFQRQLEEEQGLIMEVLKNGHIIQL